MLCYNKARASCKLAIVYISIENATMHLAKLSPQYKCIHLKYDFFVLFWSL